MGAQLAQNVTSATVKTTSMTNAYATTTTVSSDDAMTEPAGRQVQANVLEDTGKQASCAKPTTTNNTAASVTPPPIFSAPAPIKPLPGNYVDNENFTLVRKSTRLPTAKRVNKYGGVNYN